MIGHLRQRGARYASFEVTPLLVAHLPDAAGLFAASYRMVRQGQPLLPARHGDDQAVLHKLHQLAEQRPGVAAMSEGRLVGFLVAKTCQAGGRGGVYAPEWAHGAIGADRVEVYSAMYTRLSQQWVHEGRLRHLMTLMVPDPPLLEALLGLGFALVAVDALRGVEGVSASVPGLDVRRGESRDAAAVLELVQALRQHLWSAPTFKLYTDEVSQETIQKQLADPRSASWLACCQGRAVGYVHVQPANRSAAWVIDDERTASITSAFVRPDCRGRGLGAALLDGALGWARANGYVRCAVDFESANPPAAQFWLRHFQAVCHTVVRRVDERVARPPVKFSPPRA